MLDLRKPLIAALALAWLATSALAQTPAVPLGPTGGGGGGGGSGGVTVGAAITGTCPNGDVLFSNAGALGCEVVSGTGTVTSVGWTGGIVSIATPTTVPAFTIAGTSGGIPFFSSTTTWASSGLLSANALMIGGGAGVAPSTTATGTGVLTALGVNTGSAGAFVVNGGALGTPSGGTLTNATGLPYAALPALSANQVLGALTATTPSGQSVPSCSGATNALIWTSGTGFGCNTIAGGGGVSSVGFTGGLISVATPTTTPAFTVAGTSGGIPYFSAASTWASSAVLAANAVVVGGGAGVAPATTTTPQLGASGTPGSVTMGNATSGLLTLQPATGALGAVTVSVPAATDTLVNLAGTQSLSNKTLASPTVTGAFTATGLVTNADLANPATTVNGTTCTLGSTCTPASPTIPLTVGTGGTVTGSNGYYVCTTTCSITLPTPAAGAQFCIRNDSTVTTVITIAAITSVLFEKTTFNGYGTVTTGTMVSGGALGDKICLVGRDATHYLVGTFNGTWTNS